MEEVVIVGGGIAGLAVAVALMRVGVRALILEKSRELRATGSALILYANAWLALQALGVADKLRALYSAFERGYVTDVKTKSIQEINFIPNSRQGAETRAVHRKVLLEALAEELPPNSIRFSSKIVAINTQEEQGSSICIITLDDGSIIKSKVVIGCDGVHSVVARFLGLRSPVMQAGRQCVGCPCSQTVMGINPSNRFNNFLMWTRGWVLLLSMTRKRTGSTWGKLSLKVWKKKQIQK